MRLASFCELVVRCIEWMQLPTQRSRFLFFDRIRNKISHSSLKITHTASKFVILAMAEAQTAIRDYNFCISVANLI